MRAQAIQREWFLLQLLYDDPLGNVKEVTDPEGKTTEYLFDDLGRLVKVTSPNTGVTVYVYDDAGNLTTKVEDFGGTGRTTGYAYDGLDRLTAVDFPTDADWVLTYDTSTALNQKGRLASVTNGVVTTDLEYTARGEVALERTTIGGASYEVAYTYDAGGKVAEIEAPSGTTIATAYEGARPNTVTVAAGVVTQEIRDLEFLPFGPRTRAELPPEDPTTGDNTVISARQYDLRHQATEIDVTSPAGTVLDLSYTYTYTTGSPGPANPGPHLDRVVDHRDASQSRFYFYDDLERLWKATDLTGTALYTYLYDANGNRTQQVAPSGTTNYTFETETDRLAQAMGAEAMYYGHDPYGSRIWEGPLAYAATPSHVYDESNRLVEVRDPTTLAVLGAYTYDAFGRRVRRVTGEGTVIFLYGRSGYLLEERRLWSSEVRDYVYVEDELLGAVDHASATAFAWIHGDNIGTPLAVTTGPSSGTAAVVWRARYAPFGGREVDEDPDQNRISFQLRLGFGAHIADAESDLIGWMNRMMDPRTGRFVEIDLEGIAASLNPFGFPRGDPFNGWGASFLQGDINWMLDVARRTQWDLDVPDSVHTAPLPGKGPNSASGFTDPLFQSVWIDDSFLESLDCAGLKALLTTLIHESIHRSRPRWHSIWAPITHDEIYAEAALRAELAARIERICEVCPVPRTK